MIVHGIDINLKRKNVKRINLRIIKGGDVHASIPSKLKLSIFEDYVADNMKFILKSIKEMKNLKESSYVISEDYKDINIFGKNYILDFERYTSNSVEILEDKVLVRAKRLSKEYIKNFILEWCRELLYEEVVKLVKKWSDVIGVNVKSIKIRKMKRVWGNCYISKKEIKFNLDLVSKDISLIEEVVVHKLVHMLEKNHNKRFYELMTKFLPDWKERKNKLNNVQK